MEADKPIVSEVTHLRVPAAAMPPQRMRWHGWTWSVVTMAAVLAVAAACWYGYRQQQRPPPVKLVTVKAERGNIEQLVNATGNVVMQNYIDVGAKVSGQISDVFVSVGDQVKEGKLLVVIAPAVQTGRVESNRAQLARMKAELAGQNAQLDFAQLQFQRQSQLKAENATREETFESSRMSMYSAAAKVDAINAQIQQLEASMKEDEAVQKQTKVLAPLSGTVVALSARVGQPLSANQEVLMRIADLSRMTVQARVAEEDVTRLHKGMSAYFSTPGYPGKQWLGKLRQIMPLPTDDSGKQGKKAYYTVLFDVANPGRELMSGMSADVRFVLARVEHAVTIPAALVSRPDGKGMQKLQVVQADGRTRMVDVKIGLRNAERAQVISGLSEGEQVVLPASLEKPGQTH
jgi:membrane fusion protein, macrolide-specific efflux system